jgi:Tol biopolymer transport system component
MRRTLRLPLMALLLAGTALFAQQPRPTKSELCIYDLASEVSRCILSTADRIEAPNWTPDGRFLLVNGGGKLFEVDLRNPALKQISTGEVSRVNNDHGVSPDGKTLVISAGHMYRLPRAGGVPQQITQKTPSYYHGWSPDGKMLAYCAQRDKNFDLYVIPLEGGDEIRVTAHPGHDDGPDYSPDGRWIYFNSDRGGETSIWRIPAGKAAPQDEAAELVIGGPRADWFPHPSPDGKWMVYLSYPESTPGHPANKQVELRLIPLDAGPPAQQKPRTLATFTGGQGTINVNSWAPDSRSFAYVRYEYPAQ